MIQPDSVVAMAMPVAPMSSEQHDAQHDIGGHGDAGIDHRRLGVLAGEEARMQHLDQDIGGKPERERGEHRGGGVGVDGGEGAALEQHAHDRLGGENSAMAAGMVSSRANSSARFSLASTAAWSPERSLWLSVGQQHDADSDADHA